MRRFFEELKEGGPLYDGILIADLNLCKKRVINEDENKDTGAVLLGEVVGEGEDMQILGILPEEKDMVVAYYNEISTQLGEDDDE